MSVDKRPFECVVFWDDAINREECDLERYAETRDRDMLRFLPAPPHPQLFVLRDVPNATATDYILTADSPDMRRRRAFQAAVVMVKNANLRDGRRDFDWEPPDLQHARRRGLSKVNELVRDGELDFFPLVTVLEIGEVALTRTFLAGGTSGSYLLPPTSRRLLFARIDLYAAYVLRRQRAGTTGERRSPDQSGSGSSSGADGTATAETTPEAALDPSEDPTSGLVRSMAMSKALGEE